MFETYSYMSQEQMSHNWSSLFFSGSLHESYLQPYNFWDQSIKHLFSLYIICCLYCTRMTYHHQNS